MDKRIARHCGRYDEDRGEELFGDCERGLVLYALLAKRYKELHEQYLRYRHQLLGMTDEQLDKECKKKLPSL